MFGDACRHVISQRSRVTRAAIIGCAPTSTKCRCRCSLIPTMTWRSSSVIWYGFCRQSSTMSAFIGSGHAATGWTAARHFALTCGSGPARSTPTASTRNWAKWINGEAGGRYSTPPCSGRCSPTTPPHRSLRCVDDPVQGSRNGVHIGDQIDVSITIPSQDWDQHVRQQERDEYDELVEYGLRKPYSELPQTHSNDRYLDYLERIGDDKDGFDEPMLKAIWHWARAHPADRDEEFKQVLRGVARSARCTKQRDLDRYLSDYNLDDSLRGAREKQPVKRKPMDALERYRGKIRHGLSHSRKDI